MPRYFFDISDGQVVDSGIGCCIDIDMVILRLNEFEDQFGSSNGNPTLEQIEMSYIVRTLNKHGGNKPAAARELGIALKTLYNKLNRLEIAKS